MTVTHEQAIEKITAALAGGVEPEWEGQVAAVMKYLAETEGTISHARTAFDFAFLVERHTGVKVCHDVAYAALDIAIA